MELAELSTEDGAVTIEGLSGKGKLIVWDLYTYVNLTSLHRDGLKLFPLV